MTKKEAVYDLHITVDPSTLDTSLIQHPWKVHDIRNVQGMPHLIISQKYIGSAPDNALGEMAEKLRKCGVVICREKIELHFDRNAIDTHGISHFVGIIEVHYKYGARGVFGVSEKQISELNKKKLALSFNMGAERIILSARFTDIKTYEKRKTDNELPPYLEEEEREIVITDSNNSLDSFWPMRTQKDPKLSFAEFPQWIPCLK